ncbi:phage baseplate assembly protein V [Desulfosporosinus sp. PR]|uniref:phage baseplate assembly protein V n=1 Tax=Candidatus Desulfosporosinus nitrosoreducens TaxID=3401928 RepID=UPI0027F7B851|nr:phage baseplate assembly protein V [Desulfosporosinus sp. PR]MDQ7096755.1 phage baseplate assembly protein V [Desulfosporosinus sp. PR]
MGIIDKPETKDCNQEKSIVGVTLAKVTNIEDPKNLGRVRCAFLTASEDAKELDWAFVLSPFASKQSGLFFLPNVDDLVLVAFENGNIHRPYVLGSLWGSLSEAPVKISAGKNETYLIKTPNLSSIELGDKKGEETITVATPKGRKVELNDKEERISLSDGSNSLILDGKGGEVTIKCQNKLTIEVGSGNTISIDGTAGTIKFNGTQAIDIEGTQINLKATATASIKGSAQVSIQSDGVTAVKGSLLQLN